MIADQIEVIDTIEKAEKVEIVDPIKLAVKGEVNQKEYYMKQMTFYKNKYAKLMKKYGDLREKCEKLEHQQVIQFRNKGVM